MVHIKKILFLILLSNVMFSQKLGITFGTGYNTQTKSAKNIFPISYAYYNRVTPYLGVCYRDSINQLLTFKASVYYIQRGVRFRYKYDTPFYYISTDQIFTTHYISFPLKLTLNFKGFFIGGGVEGSILIKGHYNTRYEEKDPISGYENINTLNKWFGSDVFNPVDAGFNFAFGYRRKNFEIEGSMFHGLLAPAKFFVFGEQHFEFKYRTQQTFMIGINYYFKKRKNINK